MDINIVKIEDITHHDLGRIESHYFGQLHFDDFLRCRGRSAQYQNSMDLESRYTDIKYQMDYDDGKIFILLSEPFSPALIQTKDEDGALQWKLSDPHSSRF